jgi:hypothetical protein
MADKRAIDAEVDLPEALFSWADRLLELAKECDDKSSQSGRACSVSLGPSSATTLSMLIFSAAKHLNELSPPVPNNGGR